MYALNDEAGSAESGGRNLRYLLERVAERANLCLSFTHLLELLRDGDRDRRIARAGWLDSLDVVWLFALDQVENAELERVLRKAAGIDVGQLELPAAPSFLSLFPWTPEQLGEVLLKGTISDWVRVAGDSPRIRRQLDQFSGRGTAWSQQMFVDFHRAEAEFGSGAHDAVRAAIRAKIERSLRSRMVVLNKKLVASDLPAYFLPKGSLWVRPDDAFAQSALTSLDALANDLPSFICAYEVHWNMREVAGRKGHVASKFFKSPARKSDVFDWQHLVGAAYCDVFVCDAHTSECLADARSRIGRQKEVVYRGDMARLEMEIRQQLRW